MIRIRRDPTGCLARLECDQCGRRSGLFLAGPRFRDVDILRQWLRYYGRGTGWGTVASHEDGHEVRSDLCRRCRRRYATKDQ